MTADSNAVNSLAMCHDLQAQVSVPCLAYLDVTGSNAWGLKALSRVPTWFIFTHINSEVACRIQGMSVVIIFFPDDHNGYCSKCCHSVWSCQLGEYGFLWAPGLLSQELHEACCNDAHPPFTFRLAFRPLVQTDTWNRAKEVLSLETFCWTLFSCIMVTFHGLNHSIAS